MPPGLLAANGVDLSTLGFYHSDVPRFRSGPDRQVPTAKVLARAGAIRVGPHEIDARGDLQVVGQVATTENTIAACEAAEARLKAVLYAPEIRLTFTSGNGVVRQVLGTVSNVQVTPRLNKQHFQAAQGLDASFTVHCLSSFWQDVNPELRHLTAGGIPHNCPVGTAPCPISFEIMGGTTNPEIECLDASFQRVWRLRFIAILTSDESIAGDGRTGQLTRYTNGVPSNAAGLLHADDWIWMPRLGLNPHDGDAVAGLYLRLTAASSVRGRAYWWKHWL